MTTKPKTRKAKGQNTSLDTIEVGEERWRRASRDGHALSAVKSRRALPVRYPRLHADVTSVDIDGLSGVNHLKIIR
jgi:hypothetical protein